MNTQDGSLQWHPAFSAVPSFIPIQKGSMRLIRMK